jgi:hypothetical protein
MGNPKGTSDWKGHQVVLMQIKVWIRRRVKWKIRAGNECLSIELLIVPTNMPVLVLTATMSIQMLSVAICPNWALYFLHQDLDRVARTNLRNGPTSTWGAMRKSVGRRKMLDFMRLEFKVLWLACKIFQKKGSHFSLHDCPYFHLYHNDASPIRILYWS